jgi:ABC-2 type transport system permease protein
VHQVPGLTPIHQPAQLASSARVLAGAWLALVIVGPAILNVAVKSIYPVPSRVELIGAMREASNAATAQGSALLGRFYQDHPDLTPRSDSLDLEDFMSRTYSGAGRRGPGPRSGGGALRDPARRPAGAGGAPSGALARDRSPQEALSDIAGTGLARYRRFRDQVAAFHRDWQAFLLPKIFQRALLTRADYDAMPRFSYREEPDRDVSRRLLGGLAGLLVPLGIVWGAVVIGLRRFTAA